MENDKSYVARRRTPAGETIALYDTVSGKQKWLSGVLGGRNSELTSTFYTPRLFFNAVEQTANTGTVNDKTSFYIHSMETGELLRQFELRGHGHRVMNHAKADMCVISTPTGQLWFFDLTTATPKGEPIELGHVATGVNWHQTIPVMSVSFGGGAERNGVQLFATSTNQRIGPPIYGSKASVNFSQFTSDGLRLMMRSKDEILFHQISPPTAKDKEQLKTGVQWISNTANNPKSQNDVETVEKNEQLTSVTSNQKERWHYNRSRLAAKSLLVISTTKHMERATRISPTWQNLNRLAYHQALTNDTDDASGNYLMAIRNGLPTRMMVRPLSTFLAKHQTDKSVEVQELYGLLEGQLRDSSTSTWDRFIACHLLATSPDGLKEKMLSENMSEFSHYNQTAFGNYVLGKCHYRVGEYATGRKYLTESILGYINERLTTTKIEEYEELFEDEFKFTSKEIYPMLFLTLLEFREGNTKKAEHLLNALDKIILKSKSDKANILFTGTVYYLHAEIKRLSKP